MTDLYISVGIDIGADFSFMSIALPNQTFVGKPFKITHSNLNSVEAAVKKIKEAEESNSLKARIFLEFTGIYHYPLFCYLLMAINSIGFTKGGKSTNPILRYFYDKKCLSKPKMIALSAVMHKLCNIIFAVLRDNKPFEFISPEQHNFTYRNVS